MHDLIILGGDPLARHAARAAVELGAWTAFIEPQASGAPVEPEPVATWWNHLDHYRGAARLTGATGIEVFSAEQRIELVGRAILVATGTRPRRPSSIPYDGQTVYDTEEALRVAAPPPSAIVVGAGHSGAEVARRWSLAGSTVWLLEQRPEAISGRPDCDPVQRAAAAGAVCRFQTEVIGVRRRPDGQVKVFLRNQLPVQAHSIVFAIGTVGNTESLALGRADLVPDERGKLWCDEHGQTWTPTVFGLGGVVGHPGDHPTELDCRAFVRRMLRGQPQHTGQEFLRLLSALDPPPVEPSRTL